MCMVLHGHVGAHLRSVDLDDRGPGPAHFAVARAGLGGNVVGERGADIRVGTLLTGVLDGHEDHRFVVVDDRPAGLGIPGNRKELCHLAAIAALDGD